MHSKDIALQLAAWFLIAPFILVSAGIFFSHPTEIEDGRKPGISFDEYGIAVSNYMPELFDLGEALLEFTQQIDNGLNSWQEKLALLHQNTVKALKTPKGKIALDPKIGDYRNHAKPIYDAIEDAVKQTSLRNIDLEEDIWATRTGPVVPTPLQEALANLSSAVGPGQTNIDISFPQKLFDWIFQPVFDYEEEEVEYPHGDAEDLKDTFAELSLALVVAEAEMSGVIQYAHNRLQAETCEEYLDDVLEEIKEYWHKFHSLTVEMPVEEFGEIIENDPDFNGQLSELGDELFRASQFANFDPDVAGDIDYQQILGDVRKAFETVKDAEAKAPGTSPPFDTSAYETMLGDILTHNVVSFPTFVVNRVPVLTEGGMDPIDAFAVLGEWIAREVDFEDIYSLAMWFFDATPVGSGAAGDRNLIKLDTEFKHVLVTAFSLLENAMAGAIDGLDNYMAELDRAHYKSQWSKIEIRYALGRLDFLLKRFRPMAFGTKVVVTSTDLPRVAGT
ncbi:hypothetical protein ABW19_dt0205009 [Dactylella cylindrospora]|nr:hypothetical protein ABW19_dt0205009 [Dactylella cylindrospora]